MSTQVRQAQPEEFAAVADLTAAVYRGEGFSSADYEPALRDVASRAASATVLVAVQDGAVVGALTVATRGGPWAEQSVAGEGVLRMLVVDPAARGRGVAEQLVRAAVERAREDGCTLLRLSSQHEMHAAHRLYERTGFTRTPSHDWSPVPGLQLLTYALALQPWCGQCGTELDGEGHERCRAAVEHEPPRYCASCRRRMVVQVLPTGWTARCVEHGERAA